MSDGTKGLGSYIYIAYWVLFSPAQTYHRAVDGSKGPLLREWRAWSPP